MITVASEPESPVRRGAIGVLDVLGFKELLRAYSHQEVLARMRALQQRAKTESYGLAGFAGITLKRAGRLAMGLRNDFAMLSDTVVIAYSLDPCTLVAYQAAIQVLARTIGRITEAGTDGRPALAFRGCISAGEFAIDGNIILGQAINDATTHMDLADAALVWLTPAALAKVHAIPHDDLSQTLLPHRVPLKDGRTVSTLVARPTDRFSLPDENDACARVLATIPTDRLDLAIKHRNTADFFRLATMAPRTAEYALPALRVPGTRLRGGNELAGNGSEWFPVLTDDGSPYAGDEV